MVGGFWGVSFSVIDAVEVGAMLRRDGLLLRTTDGTVDAAVFCAVTVEVFVFIVVVAGVGGLARAAGN